MTDQLDTAAIRAKAKMWHLPAGIADDILALCDALDELRADNERLRKAAGVVSAVLQSERTRSGGQPFTGNWSIPQIGFRGTVDDALDMADAALAQKAPIEDMNAVECTCKGSDEMCPCQNTPPAAHMVETAEMPRAWLDVLAERERQITAEGWTPEQDDQYQSGQLAEAAIAYAISATGRVNDDAIKRFWPWSREWWKPTDPRRDLVKAGALILAEIERLDRAALAQEGGEA